MNFQLYSKYYDLLYKDKDYQSEALYVANLLRQLDPAAKKIIELGSGTGNHAVHFCKEGFQVTGLERSEVMVREAQQKNIEGFETQVDDISNYSLPGTFDAAISLFHVISYLSSNEALINCLQQTNRQLKDGGLFVFDIWYLPAVYHQRPETRIKRLDNASIEVTRLAEPEWKHEQNTIVVNYEIIVKEKATDLMQVFRESHPMRYFSIPEIELLAGQTGFELIKTEEFLTKARPSENTWGVCFVLKKIKNV